MALTNCRECGASISGEAKTCPHCGVSAPRKKRFGRFGCLWLFFGLFALGAIVQKLSPPTPPAPAKPQPVVPRDYSAEMRRACYDSIKKSLNDPNGAEMPDPAWSREQYVVRIGKMQTVVQFAFRARNGFNALRGVVGTCRFRMKNGVPNSYSYDVAGN